MLVSKHNTILISVVFEHLQNATSVSGRVSLSARMQEPAVQLVELWLVSSVVTGEVDMNLEQQG